MFVSVPNDPFVAPPGAQATLVGVDVPMPGAGEVVSTFRVRLNPAPHGFDPDTYYSAADLMVYAASYGQQALGFSPLAASWICQALKTAGYEPPGDLA